MNVLNEKDSFCCEGPLSENECYKAILSLSNNKAPGCDGLKHRDSFGKENFKK